MALFGPKSNKKKKLIYSRPTKRPKVEMEKRKKKTGQSLRNKNNNNDDVDDEGLVQDFSVRAFVLLAEGIETTYL